MSMQFVFASEEFPELATSILPDTIGVWVNGEAVPITVAGGDVDSADFSDVESLDLYYDNTQDQVDFEFDGFTATLSLKMAVTAGEVNTLKLGIADAQNALYDSALIVAANSLQTILTAEDDFVELFPNQSKTVDLVANDVGPGNSTLIVTHINGQEISAGQAITLNTGQTITLKRVLIGVDRGRHIQSKR